MLNMRDVYLMLEWSCHGLVWLGLIFLYFAGLALRRSLCVITLNQSFGLYYDATVQPVNCLNWRVVALFMALLFDLILVGLTKVVFKRKRPAGDNPDDMRYTVSVDSYSFPSGHSTRAAMLHWLLPYLFFGSEEARSRAFIQIGIWALAVCTSRFAMSRHHLTDVLLGYLIGMGEFFILIHLNWGSLAPFVG
ncbi:Phosphatidic acid phosphatase type 2 domain containing 2 [Cichlidogyrus casuarinus]|uniref:Phosphatidic acid phosphatase type 2 domain containing 2 n=1 Tax=Cichlidogyrus casuarinus TaxID=1844966 RepID=A0ABD2QNV6_9PLAT